LKKQLSRLVTAPGGIANPLHNRIINGGARYLPQPRGFRLRIEDHVRKEPADDIRGTSTFATGRARRDAAANIDKRRTEELDVERGRSI
jgi:hypothetical protein